MKRYNIINNSLGWLCFVIAAVTYLLTLEPTASFWDCPEFISQGAKLEVGHPPGNPIFILTARFFVNFTGGDMSSAAIAVNAMSALLSAATILLLFWTITHFVRRLLVGRSTEELTNAQTIIVMACGLVGALAYTWSDTFWFSAVEGEVYAFSSFCTALVVWLILKWDSRADDPHSDRYLVLVAFIIGISIAVHLLNLLTIPALSLVVYFRKAKTPNFGKALGALGISLVIVAAILYGLVPGFIEIAQYFELFFVNVVGLSYNVGVLIYAIILVTSLIWCVRTLYAQKSLWQIRVSFILSVILSGLPFMGSTIWIPVVLTVGLIIYMFVAHKLYVRVLNIIVLSILVIFVGYSSYALLLIRSTANPPMNQNAPDNVFALSSYLNREQYGETPLFYGPSFGSLPYYEVNATDYSMSPITHEGRSGYGKVVKTSDSDPDRYVHTKPKMEYTMQPKMLFPRMYSTQPGHPQGYLDWIGAERTDLRAVEVPTYYFPNGKPVTDHYGQPITETAYVPSFGQNLKYFLDYQIGYMYWRYFMWNFAGRQNDLQGQGEVTRGNWISGIPFIDNMRLGDQKLLPPDLGSDNKGHNVFYMLPLLLGILGIVAQMMRGIEGARQFWIVFLLFFMTGLAIVVYLNQPPNQPRERDYAFAGSFYAFAIWIGIGVYTLWRFVRLIMADKEDSGKKSTIAAAIAGVLGLIVPLQMVSQTWDDHDRSGRYAARDFGMNYLSSLDENAIIFTNGDNDTFPLWYAQEVEGYRRDVRVVNLAYLTTDWYANHMKMPSYEADAIEFSARPSDYAFDRLQVNLIDAVTKEPVSVFDALNDLYANPAAYDSKRELRIMSYPVMYIPVDVEKAVERGIISARDSVNALDYILVDMSNNGSLTLSQALSLDMIAHGAADGWKRPTYFASTVPDEYYLNLQPFLRSTGIAYQVTPVYTPVDGYDLPASTDKMYDNVMNRFRWGGLDAGRDIYLDETIRRMVSSHRIALISLARDLYYEGFDAMHPVDPSAEPTKDDRAFALDRYKKAVEILDLMDEKLPTRLSPYSIQNGEQIGLLYVELGTELDDAAIRQKGIDKLYADIDTYAPYIPYLQSMVMSTQRELASQGRSERATVLHLPITNIECYVPQYFLQIVGDLLDAGVSQDEVLDYLDRFGPTILQDASNLMPRQQ